MTSPRVIDCIESHTEGMPTRVVVGGLGVFPGESMAQRRDFLMLHHDDLRTFLMSEPRGHAAMSGAILQPPTRPDADWGVIFIEVAGFLPMCGHGTMGVATVLVERGMVPVVEPVTTIRLDTPAGLVVARVDVSAGRATRVTLRNVASYLVSSDVAVDVAGHGRVLVDLAFGGNFYAIANLDQVDVPFDAARSRPLMTFGLALLDAVAQAPALSHPQDPTILGCHHAQLIAPGSTAAHSRHAMVIRPGYFDRSPCGTGTSARMAQLHQRGELALGDRFVNESLLGRSFTGQLIDTTKVGDYPAVIPEITGSAWITGSSQWTLDAADPFPSGFSFG